MGGALGSIRHSGDATLLRALPRALPIPACISINELAKVTRPEPHENRNCCTAAQERRRYGATRVGTLQCSAKSHRVDQRTHYEFAFGQHR
jgi:hypothetical protein